MRRRSVNTIALAGPSFRLKMPPYFLDHSVNLKTSSVLFHGSLGVVDNILEKELLGRELVQVANDR